MSAATVILVDMLRAAERELHDAAGDVGQRVTETDRLRMAVSVLSAPAARPYMSIVAAERDASSGWSDPIDPPRED